MGVETFSQILHANKKEKTHVGVFSICSAHPIVLQASVHHAKFHDYLLVIEATSNQVNQYGGYTGKNPQAFHSYVKQLANEGGYPFDRILLGGDHLGPNAWKHEPSKIAMDKACELVRQYVKAGFRKLHLDASMYCIDDIGDQTKPLPDEIVAKRTAMLCEVAEDTWKRLNDSSPKPRYIIGTEVPVPGGITDLNSELNVTTADAARKTITVTEGTFHKHGLSDAWKRVVGLVVQPGVEFGDDKVIQYDPEKAKALKSALSAYDSLVCEAHSTDYQSEASLRALVQDHCCILKVGPWLTFAYREALFALEQIEQELSTIHHFPRLSQLRRTIISVMKNHPSYWTNYYEDSADLSLKLAFSYSDRVRYYWEYPEIVDAVATLHKNLHSYKIPHSLLSQYLPLECNEIREGLLSDDIKIILYRHIQRVLDYYMNACTG